MQPYINPNFYTQYPQFSQYSNSFNPNQQRFNQYEQNYSQFANNQLSPTIQPGLNGRVVDDISAITANEVPMNGEIAIFPIRDMSALFCKRWNSDGTINTVKYIPVIEDKNAVSQQISMSDISVGLNERLDEIERKIDDFMGTSKKETPTRTNKKDGDK